MEIRSNIAKKYSSDSSPKWIIVLLVSVVALLVIAVIILIVLVATNNNKDTKSSNTVTITTTPVTTSVVTSTTVKPSVSPSIAPSNIITTTPLISTSPAVVTTTPVDNGPQTLKLDPLDVRITLPGSWALNNTDPTNVLLENYQMNSDNKKFNISFKEAEQTITCSNGEKQTSFYVYIKGTKYDFVTCINNSTNEYRGGISSLPILGSKSTFKSLSMTFDVKDRTMMDELLDLFATIK